jgi:hypothetical protein
MIEFILKGDRTLFHEQTVFSTYICGSALRMQYLLKWLEDAIISCTDMNLLLDYYLLYPPYKRTIQVLVNLFLMPYKLVFEKIFQYVELGDPLLKTLAPFTKQSDNVVLLDAILTIYGRFPIVFQQQNFEEMLGYVFAIVIIQVVRTLPQYEFMRSQLTLNRHLLSPSTKDLFADIKCQVGLQFIKLWNIANSIQQLFLPSNQPHLRHQTYTFEQFQQDDLFQVYRVFSRLSFAIS